MSSFIQYQTKKLVDYRNGTRRRGGGGEGGGGGGDIGLEAEKDHDRLTVNSLLINFLEFTGSNQQTEIPCFWHL